VTSSKAKAKPCEKHVFPRPMEYGPIVLDDANGLCPYFAVVQRMEYQTFLRFSWNPPDLTKGYTRNVLSHIPGDSHWMVQKRQEAKLDTALQHRIKVMPERERKQLIWVCTAFLEHVPSTHLDHAPLPSNDTVSEVDAATSSLGPSASGLGSTSGSSNTSSGAQSVTAKVRQLGLRDLKRSRSTHGYDSSQLAAMVQAWAHKEGVDATRHTTPLDLTLWASRHLPDLRLDDRILCVSTTCLVSLLDL
jgi:hypothetical protein